MAILTPFSAAIGPNIVTLYNQDCLIGMREEISPKSVDVVVTSPPYNLGTNYSQYDDTVSRKEYIEWIGGEFDAEAFNLEGGNADLRRLGRRRTR